MPGWSKLGEAMLIGRVNAGELAVFCRQFGVYLDSGVGILKALSSLRKQVAGSAMGPVTERIGASIKRGESLTEAAAREPHAFDAMAISMFRVAEARGGLPETLKRLASHYDARQRFWRQARSAMIYPTAVVIVALAVGGFLTIFVLPTLVSILEDTVRGKGVDLPGPTKLLIGITKLVQSAGWWLIPLLLVLGIFGVRQGYRSKKTKRWFDEVIIRLPGVGGLVRLIDHGRFTRTLSDLLEAGVDIDSSLRLSADVLQFEPYRKAVLDARGAVRQGAELTPSLRNTRQFSPDLLAFAETGEETGQLPESLAKIAADYEERAELLIKNIGSVIQPLLMIVIGGMVGFVVVAFLMAYVAVLTSLMGGH
jgi:type II secretory pathway component PulF